MVRAITMGSSLLAAAAGRPAKALVYVAATVQELASSTGAPAGNGQGLWLPRDAYRCRQGAVGELPAGSHLFRRAGTRAPGQFSDLESGTPVERVAIGNRFDDHPCRSNLGKALFSPRLLNRPRM